MSKVTLRECLTDAGFDWCSSATIILHEVSNEDWCAPGNMSGKDVKRRSIIPYDHPILDQPFDDGYGSPEMPRFVAYDDHFIYFPGEYDGATWVTKVARGWRYYLLDGVDTPYV